MPILHNPAIGRVHDNEKVRDIYVYITISLFVLEILFKASILVLSEMRLAEEQMKENAKIKIKMSVSNYMR